MKRIEIINRYNFLCNLSDTLFYENKISPKNLNHLAYYNINDIKQKISNETYKKEKKE